MNKVKTRRGIKLGSSLSYVKKKYGWAKKQKVKSTDKHIEYMTYCCNTEDISQWKNYVEYTYKNNGTYKIRFYLNKKDKVEAILFAKNLHKTKLLSGKKVKSGLTFKAPKGKKIKTKTIAGKKVYLLPKGTKVYINSKKCNLSKSSRTIWDMYCYERNGSLGGSLLRREFNLKAKPSIDKIIASMDALPLRGDDKITYLNPKKLGKYRYFCITMREKGVVGSRSEFIYFRII